MWRMLKTPTLRSPTSFSHQESLKASFPCDRSSRWNRQFSRKSLPPNFGRPKTLRNYRIVSTGSGLIDLDAREPSWGLDGRPTSQELLFHCAFSPARIDELPPASAFAVGVQRDSEPDHLPPDPEGFLVK
jgi:hypothetical protein